MLNTPENNQSSEAEKNREEAINGFKEFEAAVVDLMNLGYLRPGTYRPVASVDFSGHAKLPKDFNWGSILIVPERSKLYLLGTKVQKIGYKKSQFEAVVFGEITFAVFENPKGGRRKIYIITEINYPGNRTELGEK